MPRRRSRSKGQPASGMAEEENTPSGHVPGAVRGQAASGSGTGGGGRGSTAGPGVGASVAFGSLPAMPLVSGRGQRSFPPVATGGARGQVGVSSGIIAPSGGRSVAPLGRPPAAVAAPHPPVVASNRGFSAVPQSFPQIPQGASTSRADGREWERSRGSRSSVASQGAGLAGTGDRGIGAPPDVGAADAALVGAEVGELQLEPAAHVVVPVSSEKMHFPARPAGAGQSGEIIDVMVNHFLIDIDLLQCKVVHQYRVEFVPDLRSPGLKRVIMRTLDSQHSDVLGGKKPVFDGGSSLYTAGPIPVAAGLPSLRFSVELQNRQANPGAVQPQNQPANSEEQARIFTVEIKLVAKVEPRHLRSLIVHKQADVSCEAALSVFDIVLRELRTRDYTPIGRSFYSDKLGTRDLGAGLVGWQGFYQSVRPTQRGLSLNVNISATAILDAVEVLKFVGDHLSDQGIQIATGRFDTKKSSTATFTPEQREVVAKALRGIQVEATHQNLDQPRKYRVKKLTDMPTYELMFQKTTAPSKSSASSSKLVTESKSVEEYFLETYKRRILHPGLPCLDVGTAEKPIYLPMEICRIVRGQRYPAKQLPEKVRTALLKWTGQKPNERKKAIEDIVTENKYDEDQYAREFGPMKIAKEATSLKARVLDGPLLLYNVQGRGGNSMRMEFAVDKGQWNMNGKKFMVGGKVAKWACVSFDDRLSSSVALEFLGRLADKCRKLGMQFEQNPIFPIEQLHPISTDLQSFCNRHGLYGGETKLDLLIAILPDKKGHWYGELKKICETEMGVVSQCCAKKHVLNLTDQYLANVALKINIKVGGRNTVLKDAVNFQLPTLGRSRTIIFGADVTHPGPGEDRTRVSSVAAVVGSQDWPEVTTYAGLLSAQVGGQEIIKELESMVKELLVCFRLRTKGEPERILFYRDGVSEGQFQEVLSSELTAIQRACASIREDYSPRITFLVVQKRHHTRFFPSATSKENVRPGTVVDTDICHPREFDFYLCSHAGILGTSRPAHYHVLWDQNEFTADTLQTLTNSLCSTYARCTKSVSIVPPAYYAHHLAKRGRLYMGAGGTGDLPALHARIKPTMFYC